MVEWAILFLVGLIYLGSACFSYSESCRQSPWYWPISVFLGLLVSCIWYGMVRYLDDKQRIFVFNMCWDTMMCMAFYVTPIVFFGVKLDRWSAFGLFLMVFGLFIIKVRAS